MLLARPALAVVAARARCAALSAAAAQLPEVMEQYPVLSRQVVPWRAMDAMGHVNHAEFVTFFESARIAYCEKVGMGDFDPTGVAPILAGLTMRYKGPVTFPDTLTIGVRTSRLSENELDQEYAAVSAATGRVVTTGSCKIVMIDYTTGQRAPVPADVEAAIRRLEPGAL